MADIRNISLTKKAQSADISDASVTTTVNLPSIVATIPDVATFGVVIETDTRINVDLSGYGEEAIPQPELIKYLQHLTSSIDVARKNFGKSLIDVIAQSEVLSQHIKPFKIDTATTIDAFSRVVYFRRTFEELVDATDDFYGVTNIDDDQTAFVEKRINESFTQIEEFRKSFGKIFNESFTRSEIISKVASLLKLETANTIEQYKVTIALVKLDNASIADQVSKIFSRGLTAELVSTNDIPSKSISTIYSDVFNLSDFITNISYNKLVLEIVGYSERTSFEISRISSDIANVPDLIAKAFSKPVADDSTTIADILFEKHIFVSIEEFSGNYFSELYTELQYSPEFGYTTNPVYLTDVITSFGFSKTILDIVDATDDFYGVTNVDDDQTAYVNKVLNDWLAVQDLFDRTVIYIRSFAESISHYEELKFSFNKSILEVSNTIETINKDLSTILSDTVVKVDTVFKLVSKASSDLIGYSELLLYSIGKNIVEIVSTTEALAISVAKILSDTTINSELINKSFGKTSSDSVSNTDQNVLLFNKAENEITSTTELFRITTNQVSSDAISISEIFSRVFVAIRDFSENSYISEVFSKSFFKATNELLSIADVVTNIIAPNKVETLYTTEVISTVTNKVLTDLVGSTDDFYGLANVDDDQTARIDKVVIESSILTELFSRITAFIRSFTDVATISEEFRNSISKIFSDQINRSDIVTKLYAKVSTETVSSSQTLSINIQSYFQQDYVELGYTGQTYTY